MKVLPHFRSFELPLKLLEGDDPPWLLGESLGVGGASDNPKVTKHQEVTKLLSQKDAERKNN